MCQYGLREVLWSHVCILIQCLSAEPRSTAKRFFPQNPCGTILMTLCSMVLDWRVSRVGPMLFSLSLLYSFFYSTVFPFRFFLCICWCFWAGVSVLIGCRSLSLSLARPTSFNNNNNNYYYFCYNSHNSVETLKMCNSE